ALGPATADLNLRKPSRLDHHPRAAFLANLNRPPVAHLVLLDGSRVAALLRRVARAGDVGTEAAALHLERRAALRALLGGDAREIVHIVDDLVDVHGFQRAIERPPEVTEYRFPVEIPFLDLVQLVLH